MVRGDVSPKLRLAKFLEHENWSKVSKSEVYLPVSEESSPQSSQPALLAQQDNTAVEKECKEEEELTSNLLVSQAGSELKQEAGMPSGTELCRSQHSNKGLPPDRFKIVTAIACNVPSEPQSYSEVLQLPQPEQADHVKSFSYEGGPLDMLSKAFRFNEQNCSWNAT
ncbi:hypothetical protein lerEdw1_015645 [Lerista edwardsae]|nr:hypothetical protein lerEdw1_015645 [Lerista edwardsae]